MADGSLRRVAILIDSLEEPMASRLLSMMPPSRAKLVHAAIESLTDVAPLERKLAIADFMQKSNPEPVAPSDDVAADLGHPPSVSVPGEVGNNVASAKDEAPGPLTFLKQIPTRVTVDTLSKENPQAVAIVLASLPPKDAADLLSEFPTELRTSALSRLATLGEIPAQAIEDISEHLRTLLADFRLSEKRDNRSVTSILSHLDNDARRDVLSDLTKHSPELIDLFPEEPNNVTPAQTTQSDTQPESQLEPNIGSVSDGSDEIPETISIDATRQKAAAPEYDFAMIEGLPAEALRQVLSEVDTEVAILSLCGMRPRIVERVLSTLPRAQSREVRQRLKHLGEVELRDIDDAQQHVARVAHQLAENGLLPQLDVEAGPARLSFAA